MSGAPFSERDSRADRALRGLSGHERERALPGPEIPELSRYEIRGKAGEGAASVVYRAWDRELGRPVAVKILRERVGFDDTARARFRREAQVMGGLSHPNVAAVHDVGEASGRPYLVMELVEGRTLADALLERSLDLPARLRVFEKVARALGAAHAKGIVHRDLKPGNILMTAGGEPKVADFGLAHLSGAEHRLTRTGAVLGTPQYMAPEQVEGAGDAVTPRTDVYALGAILYEAVSGAPPHVGTNLAELSRRILQDEPARLGAAGPDLETVCLKALAKEPARRYADAEALADDLGRALRGEPVLARPASAAYRARRTLGRHRAAAAALAALLVAGAALLWRESRSRGAGEALRRGASALERGDAEAALAEFRRAGAWLQAGRCLRRLGRDGEADEAWSRAPEDPEARLERGRLRALRSCLAALGAIAGDAGWVWVSGRPVLASGDHSGPLEDPFFAGLAALGDGRWADSAAAFGSASPDPDTTGLLGAALYLARDLDGAEREFSRALAGRPRPEWRRLRGQVRTLARNFEGAEEDGFPAGEGIPMKGLALWLRADRGQAAREGVLHQWLSQSGGSALAGARAGEKNPGWTADAWNGRPAARFDGKEQGIGLPPGYADFREGLTAFVVALATGPGAVVGLGWGFPDVVLEFGPKAATFGYAAGMQHRAVRGPASPGPALYTVVAEPSGKARLLVDGKVVATGEVPLPAVVPRDKNALGKFEGELAEILLYRRALGELERRTVEALLSARHFGKPPPPPVADGPARPADGTGLRGEYFRGVALSGEALARVDPRIDFQWGGGKPPPTGEAGPFSVRWSGRVSSPRSGPVTFITDSDDGVRLWIDGRLVVNNWTQHSSMRDWGTIDLEAGREYDLVMEFYEVVGGANVSLSWSLPGGREEVIPTGRLFPR
jgi:serine/threonine-protein kinase